MLVAVSTAIRKISSVLRTRSLDMPADYTAARWCWPPFLLLRHRVAQWLKSGITEVPLGHFPKDLQSGRVRGVGVDQLDGELVGVFADLFGFGGEEVWDGKA